MRERRSMRELWRFGGEEVWRRGGEAAGEYAS